MAEEAVILRIQIDEGQTEKRLQQLAVDLAKTRDAQRELTKARRDELISEEEYGKQSVKLQGQLKNQQTEQRALTRELELFRTATNGATDSYQAHQAQLSLAQTQYQKLAGSAHNNTEETQALSNVIKELRGTLKTVDADALDQHFRSIGNYPKGQMEDFIQQLVKLRIEEKGLAAGSQELAANQNRQVGFLTAAQRAAAEAGKSYADSTTAIENYAKAIEPATEQLIKLEQEEARLIASGGASTQAYQRIGFQMQKLKKDIAEVPVENKKLADSLEELDNQTGAFGGQVGNLKEKWAQAKAGAESLKLGLTGVKAAFAATGIGLFIIALGLLYEYFTKTDEGQEDFAAGLAYLKGLFSVLEGAAITLGKGLAMIFKDPKQAGKDFLQFLESQLINRVKSFGVLWQAIKEGDATKFQDSIIQFNTGIENGTAKVKALTEEMKRAAAAAYDISRAQDALDDAQRASLLTLEENKNLIDKLVLSARDRSLSEKERLANLDRASKLETDNLNTTLRLAEIKLRIVQQQNDEAERTGKLSDEQKKAEVTVQTELIRLAGESATLQQTIQNRRSLLIQQEAAEDKAAADKRRQQRVKDEEQALAAKQAALRVQLGYLDLELQETRKGSEEELNVLRRKLDTQRKLELTAKDLTVAQRGLIERKYYADSLKLEQDHQRDLATLAFDAALSATQVRLTATREGSDEETELRAQAIEQQLQKELAAIDTRASAQERASKEALLRANAEKATADVDYEAATRKLENFLAAKRQFVERDYATGKLTEEQYQQAVYATEQSALAARTALATDYHKNTDALSKQRADLEISEQKRITDQIRTETQNRIQLAQDLGGQVGELLGKSLTEQGATLEGFFSQFILLLLDVLEKQALVATAQATIGSLASPESIATAGVAGLVKAAVLTAAIKAAFAVVKAAVSSAGGNESKFAEGGILQGPSHAQGGIQLYSRTGYHFGEAQGGEPILVSAVSRNRALLAAASAINVAAGGRPLAPALHMASGGITTSALVRESVRGGLPGLDYDALGRATAKALQQNPPINRWVDWKNANDRNTFTDNTANV